MYLSASAVALSTWCAVTSVWPNWPLLLMSSVCPSICLWRRVFVYTIHPTCDTSVWKVNRKCPLGTRFYSFQSQTTYTDPVLSNFPTLKFINFIYSLYLAFGITWPFCLRCYEHVKELSSRWWFNLCLIRSTMGYLSMVNVATPIYLRLSVSTIEQYRANCSNGADTAFHRTHSCST